MTDEEKAAALLDRVRADPFYRWDDPVDAAMRRAVASLRVNGMLVDALEACRDYIPGSEVRSWPPGSRLKDEAMKKLTAALAEARKP